MKVLGYPVFPSEGTFLAQKCRRLGWELVDIGQMKIGESGWKSLPPVGDVDADVIVFRHGSALKTRDPFIATLSRTRKIINYYCMDVQKRNVERVFEMVFGYPLSVNPYEYSGEMVCKSNGQAAHDGVIVQGPIKKEVVIDNKYTYEKLVNTVDSKGETSEYRLPYFRGIGFPVMFRAKYPATGRFSQGRGIKDPKTLRTLFEPPEFFFSREEIVKLIKMAGMLNLDYGDLDVLRDNDNGRIYLVDVNDTAWRRKCVEIEEAWPATLKVFEEFISLNNFARRK